MSALQVLVDDAAFPASAFEGTQWEHQTGKADALAGTLSVCHAEMTTTAFSIPPFLTAFFAGQSPLFFYHDMLV